MTRWVPAALAAPFFDFARAAEKQFAPLRPVRPVKLPEYDQAQLTDAFADDNRRAIAINKDTNQIVQTALVAGVWKWRKYDGTAL